MGSNVYLIDRDKELLLNFVFILTVFYSKVTSSL